MGENKVTCRIVFEKINEFGQIERHIHYTDDYKQAKKGEAEIENRLHWIPPRVRYLGE